MSRDSERRTGAEGTCHFSVFQTELTRGTSSCLLGDTGANFLPVSPVTTVRKQLDVRRLPLLMPAVPVMPGTGASPTESTVPPPPPSRLSPAVSAICSVGSGGPGSPPFPKENHYIMNSPRNESSHGSEPPVIKFLTQVA